MVVVALFTQYAEDTNVKLTGPERAFGLKIPLLTPKPDQVPSRNNGSASAARLKSPDVEQRLAVPRFNEIGFRIST